MVKSTGRVIGTASPNHKYYQPKQFVKPLSQRKKAVQTKPIAIGKKPQSYSVFGAFKKLAGFVARGVAKVVTIAGNLAQKVLDAVALFPFLRPLLKTPIPFPPPIPPLTIETTLRGIAVTGKITEKLANAMELLAQGRPMKEVLSELPVKEVVMFVLSPILEMFGGIFSLLRVGKPVPPARLQKMANVLKSLINKVPPPMRKMVLDSIETKLGFDLPPTIQKIITG